MWMAGTRMEEPRLAGASAIAVLCPSRQLGIGRHAYGLSSRFLVPRGCDDTESRVGCVTLSIEGGFIGYMVHRGVKFTHFLPFSTGFARQVELGAAPLVLVVE
jgi:hypothetical protein